MHPKPPIGIEYSKSRICLGLERYGEFSSWAKAEDLIEAVAAIGVGFDIELDGGPCDIVLRNTESIFRPASADSVSTFDTPVIFFDSYDVTHLAPPIVRAVARPEVKAFLRSSSFRNPASYFRRSQGGSYYNHVFSSSMNGLSPDVTPRDIEEGDLDTAIKKIVVRNPVMPFLSDQHLEFIKGAYSPLKERYADVLFNDWGVMQKQVDVVDTQTFGLNIRPISSLFPVTDSGPSVSTSAIPSQGLQYLLYLAALGTTKVLISPWGQSGFSQIDFAALMCGTVVVKPECSNIRTWVDIYDPFQGYMQYCSPCLSDLRDIVMYILNNLEEYTEVTEDARKLVWEHYGTVGRGVGSWIHDFRLLCENILSGNTRDIGDFKGPLPASR